MALIIARKAWQTRLIQKTFELALSKAALRRCFIGQHFLARFSAQQTSSQTSSWPKIIKAPSDLTDCVKSRNDLPVRWLQNVITHP